MREPAQIPQLPYGAHNSSFVEDYSADNSKLGATLHLIDDAPQFLGT
jgi:hypothetical protein